MGNPYALKASQTTKNTPATGSMKSLYGFSVTFVLGCASVPQWFSAVIMTVSSFSSRADTGRSFKNTTCSCIKLDCDEIQMNVARTSTPSSASSPEAISSLSPDIKDLPSILN
jgi:hypothetical protein